MNADRLGKLIALVTLATLATRYDVFLFLVDYVRAPIHHWTLVLASLCYAGFGIMAVIGLWVPRSWGNWGFYLYVLTGTIHFSASVYPVSPYFENDTLYFAWFLGGNVLACLAVIAVGSARRQNPATAR
jgi:hypothetical protein